MGNLSKNWGFVWWGTAGCASRTTKGILTRIGVDDLRPWDVASKKFLGNGFVHHQSLPEGSDGLPIICNSRNPYTRYLTSWKDLRVAGDERSFERYLKDSHAHCNDHDVHYAKQWSKLGVTPDYMIRMEHMAEDLRKAKPLLKKGKEALEEAIAEDVDSGPANENKLDSYIASPNGVKVQDCKPYYNQELADCVYENNKEVFDFFGYEKDSWLL